MPVRSGMLIDKDDAHLLFLYAKACLGQGDVINTIAMLTKSILLAEKQQEGLAQAVQSVLLRGETLLKLGDVEGCRGRCSLTFLNSWRSL